jgi:hypothetical protein
MVFGEDVMRDSVNVALEAETEEELTSIRNRPVTCGNSTGGVGLAAKKLGVTCQELFRRAYVDIQLNILELSLSNTLMLNVVFCHHLCMNIA